MTRHSVSFIRRPIAIRNASRSVNKMAGRYIGDIDLRKETVEMLLSQVLMQLPLDR